jgi:hypothetical protein
MSDTISAHTLQLYRPNAQCLCYMFPCHVHHNQGELLCHLLTIRFAIELLSVVSVAVFVVRITAVDLQWVLRQSLRCHYVAELVCGVLCVRLGLLGS